jgi:hypothetical protein
MPKAIILLVELWSSWHVANLFGSSGFIRSFRCTIGRITKVVLTFSYIVLVTGGLCAGSVHETHLHVAN